MWSTPALPQVLRAKIDTHSTGTGSHISAIHSFEPRKMAVHTILLDFTVDPSQVKTESQLSALSGKVENFLRNYLNNLKVVSSFNIDGGIYKLYTSDRGAVSNVRVFTNGMVTVNIEYFKAEQQEPLLNIELKRRLEGEIRQQISIKHATVMLPIKRNGITKFLYTSDDRLLEYDIDAVVFEEHSAFQKIQILHSKCLGNMLVLDDVQNLAESDLVYTETLMGRGIENYEGKDIVILGGGDGALLYELLKEKPRFVTMLEIDEVVMKACAKYMRSVCGDVLDNRSGPNYKIIVGDCIKALERYVKDSEKFDYVFADLTDIPIYDNPANSELWKFILKLLEMSFKVLKPGGKYMTHTNGANSVEALKMYEAHLNNFRPRVKYTTSKAFVPSFMEEWVFYQVQLAE